MKSNKESNLLPMASILKTWWPLAASWILMGMELPVLSAFVARLADPKIHLAAYGGIVFPLALIIEAPVIMLLAASTALSKDWASYQKLRTYMLGAGATLTILHIIIAFTPFYYTVVGKLIGAPEEIIEPARIGLMIMTPWTWAIAYRRFNQGILIRFGHSGSIGIGTGIRLGVDAVVLISGLIAQKVPGIVVATSAVSAGVVAEALYVGLRVQPVLKNELKTAKVIEPALTYRAFAKFYAPLAMTSLMMLMVQPMGSAALSRMPRALDSLAVWPIVSGLIFMLRSMGMAFNEVVVARLDDQFSFENLRRFTSYLTGFSSLLLVIFVVSPMANWWLQDVSALEIDLVNLAKTGLWIGILMPGLTTYQSWYQGVILHSRKTRAIPEAVGIFLLITSTSMWMGVLWQKMIGLYVTLGAFILGSLIQTLWLKYRSSTALDILYKRDVQIE
ncbi:MAG: hypothetical protein IMY76_06040 [Chloroflexi bacterium]|nr:hypothetical protein [Chloroflexota bacterium]